MAQHQIRRVVVGTGRRDLATGLVAVAVSIAVCTLAIFGLREIAPVLSLGVVYLLAGLVVSANWGLALGLVARFSAPWPSTSCTSRRPAG